MHELSGANALLTGAAGGIGRHIALALGGEGVRLAVSGRDAGSLAELCRALRSDGVTAEPVVADLADPLQTATLIERFRVAERTLRT